MWTIRTCAWMGFAAVLAAGALAPAAEAQDCSWYARKALEQQKVNADRKCGFRGPEWNRDLNAHMIWCKDVAPQVWRKQAQLRDQQLAKCSPAR
jgi:hypothetical protein